MYDYYGSIRSPETCPSPFFGEQKRIIKRREHFPFAAKATAGLTLLVGEGNLSFARSLARQRRVSAYKMLATVYEPEKEMSDAAYENAKALMKMGVRVKTGVDATKLDKHLPQVKYRLIVFQFPNVASRDPLYDQNPNHVLVTRFLKSAKPFLHRFGDIAISTVDSPHYEGAFKMREAGRKAGFGEPDIYTFSPKRFPGYQHQNTADEDSAADGHKAFATFVFSSR